MILATRFTFIVERSWKNMYFHPELAWLPATYDVISRNHSNGPSLNSSQNLRERWTNSYWKRRVLMFYPLGKNSEKPYGGVASTPPPPPVRPRVNWSKNNSGDIHKPHWKVARRASTAFITFKIKTEIVIVLKMIQQNNQLKKQDVSFLPRTIV